MALVQEWTNAAASSTVNNITGTATTAGNFLHATVAVLSVTDIVTLSDAAGNTWQEVPSSGDALTSARVRHFYALGADSISSLTVTRVEGGSTGAVFLREFDDPIGSLIEDNGADNPNTGQPPPCEVTFAASDVLVIGSIVLGVTSRILTLQNTTEFTALSLRESSALETVNAYGVLDNGTYGPDWDITTGSANQYTGSVTSAFGSVARPIASAGPDQTVAAGAADVQLAGTASAGGGAGAPYAHTWRIISDSTSGAALSATNVEDPTLDIGPSGGTIVLGYKVTDTGSVESLEDTVTITAIGVGSTAVPISDVTTTGWAKEPAAAVTFYEVLADGSLDTYVYYQDPVGNVVAEFGLSGLSEPTGGAPMKVWFRPSTFNAIEGSVTVIVKQGASTVIATFGPDEWTLDEVPQYFEHALSSVQIAAITDFAALRLRFEGTVTPDV